MHLALRIIFYLQLLYLSRRRLHLTLRLRLVFSPIKLHLASAVVKLAPSCVHHALVVSFHLTHHSPLRTHPITRSSNTHLDVSTLLSSDNQSTKNLAQFPFKWKGPPALRQFVLHLFHQFYSLFYAELLRVYGQISICF